MYRHFSYLWRMATTRKMKAIGDQIRKAKGKMSYYRINQDIGVTPPMMKKIEEGAHCSVGTLIKVCEFVGLQVEIKRINNEEGD